MKLVGTGIIIDNAGWYEGNKTFIQGLKDEIKEVETEIKENNSVYLEDELKQYWIKLLNKIRKDKNLTLYSYDSILNYTAKLGTDLSIKKGYIDHKVNPDDSSYDFEQIL